MKTYIMLKDSAEKNFLLDKNILKKKAAFVNGKKITIEKYASFSSMDIQDTVRLFYIPEKSDVEVNKNFIEVTENRNYKVDNILKGSLRKTNLVIEGGDGAGKSTLVNELAQKGILTQDRAVEEVTRSMKTYLTRDERIQKVERYLRNNPAKNLVFLYISDENVLHDRVFNREIVDEFDKEAIVTQRLYLDTYNTLKNYPNLFLVDGLNKNPQEIANEVIRLTQQPVKCKTEEIEFSK
mgnify:CR=1 FL=1